jgi:hypothetical protein
MNKKFFITLGVTAVICGTPIAFAKPVANATEFIKFKPTIPAGKAKRGFCWTGAVSVVRDDAWRCTTHNEIFDPCFATEKKDLLVCGVDPNIKDSGFGLQLTKPLPKPEKAVVPAVNVWMIKLVDGAICKPFTGTKPFFPREHDSFALAYGCSDSAKCDGYTCPKMTGIVEDSIKSGIVWTAKKVTCSQNGSELKILKTEVVPIAKVWE